MIEHNKGHDGEGGEDGLGIVGCSGDLPVILHILFTLYVLNRMNPCAGRGGLLIYFFFSPWLQ